ncbi:amidohydrolase family protein [Conexibacter sp. CPCC 206217]|uniref:amidohydrolase family protein n=1 Tax=Conexibacter sp. CPCC 206217 TaxID=3064574 RepID=UPI002728D891|nr:amidohydrolase family protein [Conexibacter sp. CPCC 206217]MDO8208880.1 amidohydrolase family protein [Conexibacter sp. CPCC 206217]
MHIIDSHVHAWPDAIAEKAIGAPDESLHALGDGKVRGLLDALDKAGIAHAVVVTIANEARHVASNNAFAGSLESPLLAFGSIHAELSAEENVASLRANGLRGVKLNPPFQGFALDDPRLRETLDALQGEFVLLTHTGVGGATGSEATCTPAMVRQLARDFPRLDIVAAHFGGYHKLDDAERDLVGAPVYLDTSWPPSMAELDRGRIRRLIERHGPDRILFGSDWPMGDPVAAIAAVEALGLPDEHVSAILGGNAARLLGLSIV